jgi:hypothetical protein
MQIFHPDMANLHQKEYMETVFNRTDNYCSRAPLFNFMFSPGDPTKPSEPIVVSGASPVLAQPPLASPQGYSTCSRCLTRSE